MRDNAEAAGFYTLRIEAPDRLSLPALIAPELRVTLLRLSKVEQAKAYSVLALRALAGFATALKVKFQDIEVGLDFEPEPGLADNGDLEHDLAALLEAVGLAAKKAGSAVVMFKATEKIGGFRNCAPGAVRSLMISGEILKAQETVKKTLVLFFLLLAR